MDDWCTVRKSFLASWITRAIMFDAVVYTVEKSKDNNISFKDFPDAVYFGLTSKHIPEEITDSKKRTDFAIDEALRQTYNKIGYFEEIGEKHLQERFKNN